MKKILDSKMLMFIFIICLFVLGFPNKVLAKTAIKADNVSLSYTQKTFTGLYQKPTVTVKIAGGKLTENQHYKVTYSDNRNVGTAKVIIEGIGNYGGTIVKTFKINKYPLTEDNISLSYTQKTFTGLYQKPTVTVKIPAGKLTENQHYKVTYSDNRNAGTAKVKIVGIGNYGGVIEKKFTIGKYPLTEDNVSLSYTQKNFTGLYQKPTVTVKIPAGKLTENQHYKVTYSDNRNVGTAKVKIEGIGNYEGTIVKNFTIGKYPLTEDNVSLSYTQKNFTGLYQKPTVTVKIPAGKLTENQHYKVTYSDNRNVGTAKVVIEGIGNYGGTIVKTFKINKYPLTADNISLSYNETTYTGEYQKPTVTVKIPAGKLTENQHYKVTYSDNRNAGTAKVKIEGIGNYGGTIEKTFRINKLYMTSSASMVNRNEYVLGKDKKPKFEINGIEVKAGEDFEYKEKDIQYWYEYNEYGDLKCWYIFEYEMKTGKNVHVSNITLTFKQQKVLIESWFGGQCYKICEGFDYEYMNEKLGGELDEFIKNKTEIK